MNTKWTTRSGVDIIYSDVLNLEKRGLSDRQIAKAYGLSHAGFLQISYKCGWERQYPHFRSDKGKPRVDPEEKRLRYNAYHREYQRKNRDKYYYRYVRDGKRVISEHRLIAERVLGRRLKRNEVVHHVDLDPTNNVNSNLVICDQDYHLNVMHGMRALELREVPVNSIIGRS